MPACAGRNSASALCSRRPTSRCRSLSGRLEWRQLAGCQLRRSQLVRSQSARGQPSRRRSQRRHGGLRTEQLAGADLTGAKLPEQLKKLYDSLENVKGISESARKIFLAVLAGCLYCWLTIATTTDVNLITNRNSSPLPIIQTADSDRRLLRGRAAAGALRLFLFPFLSAKAVGGTRLAARGLSRRTAAAHQSRSLAAERPGAGALAQAECRSSLPVVLPIVDFGAAGVVDSTHHHASVLGTLPADGTSGLERRFMWCCS